MRNNSIKWQSIMVRHSNMPKTDLVSFEIRKNKYWLSDGLMKGVSNFNEICSRDEVEMSGLFLSIPEEGKRLSKQPRGRLLGLSLAQFGYSLVLATIPSSCEGFSSERNWCWFGACKNRSIVMAVFKTNNLFHVFTNYLSWKRLSKKLTFIFFKYFLKWW